MNSNISKIDSDIINLLRFPLAVMVVALHACPVIKGWDSTTPFIGYPFADVAGYVIVSIGHVITHVAVPVFFLISGYLFFATLHRWDTSIWKSKMLRRIRTLLIPYLIWNAIYLLSKAQIPTIADFWCSKQWNLDATDIWGTPAFSTSPALVPMWFIRDLIVTIVLSPIFYFLLNSTNNKVSITAKITIVLLGFLYLTRTSIPVPGFSLDSLFFFGLGSFLSLNNQSIVIPFGKYNSIVTLLTIILFSVEVYYDGHNTNIGGYIYPFWILFAVFFTLGVAKNLVERYSSIGTNAKLYTICKKYSDTTFFLFASHFIIISYISAIPRRIIKICTQTDNIDSIEFVNSHAFSYILSYIITICLTVLVCVLVCKLLNKYLPKISQLLCGR